MKVAEVMTTDVIALTPKQTLREAAETFQTNGISGAPVVQDGRVVGVISEGDVVEALKTTDLGYDLWFPSPFEIIEVPIRNAVKWRSVKEELEDVSELHVEDAMTKQVKHIHPDDTLEEAAEKMSKHRINRLPVVRDGELVGIVTREDIIHGLLE